MIERVRNVVIADRKKGRRILEDDVNQSLPKKKAKGCDLLRRYPLSTTSVVVEDAQCIEQHKKGIKNELLKKKPRDQVLLPLMRSTYQTRRMYILKQSLLMIFLKSFQHYHIQLL